MKMTNNINEDLKEDIQESKEQIAKYEMKVDDLERTIQNIKEE